MDKNMKKRPLSGAAAMTHKLKMLGNGHMEAGIERLAYENRQAGYQEGFQQGRSIGIVGLLLERFIGKR